MILQRKAEEVQRMNGQLPKAVVGAHPCEWVGWLAPRRCLGTLGRQRFDPLQYHPQSAQCRTLSMEI